VSKDIGKILGNVSTTAKVAAIFFILGKIHFIPALGYMAIDMDIALIFAGIYIFCIVISIILSLVAMFRLNTKDKKLREQPSVEYIKKWAKEYNLVGGK